MKREGEGDDNARAVLYKSSRSGFADVFAEKRDEFVYEDGKGAAINASIRIQPSRFRRALNARPSRDVLCHELSPLRLTDKLPGRRKQSRDDTADCSLLSKVMDGN